MRNAASSGSLVMKGALAMENLFVAGFKCYVKGHAQRVITRDRFTGQPSVTGQAGNSILHQVT